MTCAATCLLVAVLATSPDAAGLPTVSLAGGTATLAGVTLAPLTPPVPPTDAARLVELARLDAAGAEAVVVSVLGRFAGGAPSSGSVEVLLLPDTPRTAQALDTDDELLLPVRLAVDAGSHGRWLAGSAPAATLAFPAYRVFAYNLTSQAVEIDVVLRAVSCAAAPPSP